MSQAVVNPAVEYVDAVLADPATTLAVNARHVLGQLALRWNRHSQTSLIGVGRINPDGTRTGLMLRTGLSERAIRYAFREIEASGLAVPEGRAGQTNVWRFPAVDAAAGTPARGAPLHVVHPSVEQRGARGAPTPARGAPTPARGAPVPVLKPVDETGPVELSDQRIADTIARYYSGEVKVRRRQRRDVS